MIRIISFVIIFFIFSIPFFATELSAENSRNRLNAQSHITAQNIPLLNQEDLDKYSKPAQPKNDPALRDAIKDHRQAIPLDTKNLKYFSYFKTIENKINRHRTYPEEARESFLEGISEVQFTLLPNGQVEDVKIAKSSGFAIFDKNAIQTIEKSAPFDPFPRRIEVPRLIILTKIKYHPNLIPPEELSLGVPLKKFK